MSTFEKIKEKFKQFKPTSWVINNKTVTYVATIVITMWGLTTFISLTDCAISIVVWQFSTIILCAASGIGSSTVNFRCA